MRRRLLLSVSVVLAVVVGAALVGFPVYVKPQIDRLRKAGAILVIGGGGYSERYRYGFQLAKEGWAPHLVLSNPDGARDRYLTKRCATLQVGFTAECFVPDPATTLGEARELRRLAAEGTGEQ